MLYYLPNILVVSDRPEHVQRIERAFEGLEDIHVYKADKPERVMEYLNKLKLVENRIPAVIFIDPENPLIETENFLQMLDRRYSFQTRDRVVLINNNHDIGEIMKLLLADCVHDIINTPMIEVELRGMLERMSYNEGLLE